MDLQELKDKATASEATLIEKVEELVKGEASIAAIKKTLTFIRDQGFPDDMHRGGPQLWLEKLKAHLNK
jgi:hypothetical protein